MTREQRSLQGAMTLSSDSIIVSDDPQQQAEIIPLVMQALRRSSNPCLRCWAKTMHDERWSLSELQQALDIPEVSNYVREHLKNTASMMPAVS